jgi:ATP-dependent DNA helicase RecG
MYLAELHVPVQKLKGVGPAVQRDLAGLGILSAGDLLLHLPRDYDDRSVSRPLLAALAGEKVNTLAVIEAHQYFGAGPKRTLKIIVRDESAKAELACFGRNFLARSFPPGMKVRLAGIFQRRFGTLQSSAFEIEEEGKNHENFSSILPIYPLSGGLTQKTLRRLTALAYDNFGIHLLDELPPSLTSREGILSLREALRAVHMPRRIEETGAGRRSLAYRELFFLQISVVRRALRRRSQTRLPKTYSNRLQEKLRKALPFRLTPDQDSCVDIINRDIMTEFPMARLLQGDVGSGKTLVAFFAALPFVDAGRQAALMAPTELLARQHADNAARLLEPLGVRLAFYSGTVPAKARRPLLDALRTGEIDLVIGTHALFSEDVAYRDLGLVIIDEQHRFGVSQRNRLFAKGIHPDILVMSATPIPQTLALSAFGDLDVSNLHTMPPGRKPVITHLAREGKEKKVYDWVARELSAGRQAYFVYPIIEESEKSDVKDAETMYLKLKEDIFPDYPVGLIHSKIPEEEKREIMARFSRGEVRVLAATSVVEVGVDVPNATCMVVEHAERFGLAALHQLRGRVGRGRDQSYAFFVYEPELTEIGKRRLLVLKETSDGFRIAEEDLLLRGPGEMTGLRQSGLLDFRAARLPGDADLMLKARKEAYTILEADPALLGTESAGIRAALGGEGS